METRGSDGSFLPLVLERSPRADRLRRRCAAIGAAVIFVTGLLAALGSTLLALAALVAMSLVAVAVAMREQRASSALRRLRSFVPGDVLTLVRRGRRAPGETGWPLPASSVVRRSDDEITVESAAVAEPPVWRGVAGALSELLPALQARLVRALPEPSQDAQDVADVADVEGSRCNALGLALRRAGRTQQAAALHEAALLIFARLGNRRAEALTANVLGVALAEIGDQDAAFEQFERARALLHELGDRHWEGKVLANIGLAKHRVGREDEALEHLQSALANLSPETEAYRRVERRLELAS